MTYFDSMSKASTGLPMKNELRLKYIIQYMCFCFMSEVLLERWKLLINIWKGHLGFYAVNQGQGYVLMV